MNRKTYHKIINILLLALFISYFSSVTLFYHCHTEGGVTIVHSHFFNDSGDKNSTEHNHSSSQINLISHLSAIALTITSFFFSFNKYIIKTYKQTVINDIHIKTNLYFHNISLRAPPILFIYQHK